MSFALYGSHSFRRLIHLLYHIRTHLSRGFRKIFSRQNDEKAKTKLCKPPSIRNTGRAGTSDSCTTRPPFYVPFALSYYIITHFWAFVKGSEEKNFKKVFHKSCGKLCGKLKSMSCPIPAISSRLVHSHFREEPLP